MTHCPSHDDRPIFESLEDRVLFSVTIADLTAAGINAQATNYIDTNTYRNQILAEPILANVLTGLNHSHTVPANATVITSGSQFSQITAGTTNNPKNYLIQGNITRTSSFDVPSNVNIYVDGSIFYAGTFTAPGGVHSAENTGTSASAIFRVMGKQNVNIIGINNAVLHSTNDLNVNSPHASAVVMGNGSDNITVEGFEIHHVWEGVVAHGGGLDNIVVKNNYIHDTLDRAIWSLLTTNFRAVHNFIQNAGVDSLDWDFNTQYAIAYENVSLGAGRWAGFVEESTNDSYFIRGLAIMADFENPNSGWQMGWADNGTKSNPAWGLTENNYFIDNVVYQQPGSFITSNGSPGGGGSYFAKEGTYGKGPTWFWGNRGFGVGDPPHASGSSWVNAFWDDNIPNVPSGNPNLPVNPTQLLADLNAQYNGVTDTTVPVVTVDALQTTDDTPELTGTVSDNDPNVSIVVSVNGSDYAATNNGDGTWTLADNTVSPLPAGTYDVSVTATDTAGNIGVDGTTDELTVIGPITGDLNGNGFVGIDDLNLILGNWNQTVTPGDPLQGDPSGDGFVGIGDLGYVLGNWNAGTPPIAETTTVTQPVQSEQSEPQPAPVVSTSRQQSDADTANPTRPVRASDRSTPDPAWFWSRGRQLHDEWATPRHGATLAVDEPKPVIREDDDATPVLNLWETEEE